MLDIKRHLWPRLMLCLGIAWGAAACMPTGFLASKKSSTDTQALTTDPKTQANDRPTETGAGVPGYLVNCSEISATGELVQVGCSVSNAEGTRVKTAPEAWKQYDIKLPVNSNPSIKVAKSISSGNDAWDVAFFFTGATPSELQSAARGSTYSYTYIDEQGKTVKMETARPVVTSQSAANQTSQNCSGGVVVEGVCVVSVPLSCTDYCGQSQMKVHPWVTERFGSASAANKQACADLYAQMPNSNPNIPSFPFIIAEVVTERGLGCHNITSGQPLFDTTPTDPSADPYIGYTRICACQ